MQVSHDTKKTNEDDSHCMSSLTEVDTGTEMLLLAAWQVKMVCKSLLFRSLTTSSLLTLLKSVTNQIERII